MALNTQQELFIEHYLQCWNATEAAKRAGYSEKTAYSQGHRLLKNDEIAARVRERIAETAMSADEVLLRLADHARADIVDLLDPASGTVDLQKAVRLRRTHVIKKFKYTTRADDEAQTETVELEMYDAQAALVHLGKHLGLFKERHELTGKDGAPIEHRHLPALPDDVIDELLLE